MEKSFRDALIDAQVGNENGLIYIINIYSKLIKKYSCINGKFDEDLYQIQLIKIVNNISKFDIPT